MHCEYARKRGLALITQQTDRWLVKEKAEVFHLSTRHGETISWRRICELIAAELEELGVEFSGLPEKSISRIGEFLRVL